MADLQVFGFSLTEHYVRVQGTGNKSDFCLFSVNWIPANAGIQFKLSIIIYSYYLVIIYH